MVILGLTGSIAMGKTTAARMFSRLGFPVYDADRAVHRLLGRGGAAVGLVDAAFPGVTRDDLDVSIDGTLLTLSGKRELFEEKKGEDYLWQERQSGRFMRTLRLPAPVKESDVVATYENGILMVKLPKLPLPAKNKITVK